MPKTGLNLSEELFLWSSPNFGRKSELILSEDLFLFGVHLILDGKTGPILGGKSFIVIFVILKFFEFPGLPLSKILRTLLVKHKRKPVILK